MLLSKYKREPEAWHEHVVPYCESETTLSSADVSEEWVSEVARSCPTLCNPMGHSLQGSSVHVIFQARVLEWVAISFSRGYFWPSDWTRVSHIEADTTVWATMSQRLHHCPLDVVPYYESEATSSSPTPSSSSGWIPGCWSWTLANQAQVPQTQGRHTPEPPCHDERSCVMQKRSRDPQLRPTGVK